MWGLLVLVAGSALPLEGQLISPGKLARPHLQLEGVRNCTLCHTLRQKGADRALCLACHIPLAERIQRNAGFHATLPEPDCATCHKEHFGADFDLLHLDTLRFVHDRTGYPLEGGHRDAGCRECHRPANVVDPGTRAFKEEHGALERTFLGLGTTCLGCHQEADPHREQFGDRGCDTCHDVEGWEGAAGFDHDRSAYPLTGLHRAVECTGCHLPLPGMAGVGGASGGDRSGAGRASGAGVAPSSGALRFTPVASSSCATCHDDPHAGAMQGSCAGCHSTSGWASVDRNRLERTFDHSTTGFELEESHARLPCAFCHDARTGNGLEGITLSFAPGAARRSYPPPRRDRCASCHDDAHGGELAGEGGTEDCRGCHGQGSWLPARYGLDRHDRESAFVLEGAHRVTPCAGCHRPGDGALTFRLGLPACVSCHAPANPHGDQFDGRACDECHSVQAFAIPDFDHTRTRYLLEGAHLQVSCAGCHLPGSGEGSPIRYRPLGTGCADCHQGGS